MDRDRIEEGVSVINTCKSMSEKHGRVKGKGRDGRLMIIRAKIQKLKFVTRHIVSYQSS
jgi:hypothetical protein